MKYVAALLVVAFLFPSPSNAETPCDFKGISDRSFDGRGNYSLGLREQIIFPEIQADKVEKTRGMTITITTTAKSDPEGRALLKFMGMPFAS
jgi:large subunit ribosomal protein L5